MLSGMCVCSVCSVVPQRHVSLQQPQEERLLEQAQKQHTAWRPEDVQPHAVWNRCSSPICRYSVLPTDVHREITQTSDWPTCCKTVLSFCVTAFDSFFLLFRDDATELQRRARCAVLFLPEGKAAPARPRLRVSDRAELFMMLKEYCKPPQMILHHFCIRNLCSRFFFFQCMKVIRIHPHLWIFVPNVHPIIVGFALRWSLPLWVFVRHRGSNERCYPVAFWEM